MLPLITDNMPFAKSCGKDWLMWFYLSHLWTAKSHTAWRYCLRKFGIQTCIFSDWIEDERRAAGNYDRVHRRRNRPAMTTLDPFGPDNVLDYPGL